ncbi:cobyrinic acid a,c-diamide synthase [Methanohalophilus levihalophilus]|uniref:Ni-sirohydrochlorin a,c-diamide synthase n=1 Tax=Methanohalophilus levihalophilus TaxID=1431282 RepID=UPI001FD8F5C9|nr:Ni-sirohydrochlorin a,c-diamide synthase [Methanohalophilus levihalophilus]MBP2029169.1 cobyrinic acid a,c-diamide synthase [Methanohalophilus levihalophilus]
MVDIPRILISADRSSSGKTTIVSGLLAALVSKGYNVQPFKVALDYIDPSYHSEITGRRARNVDGYLMDENTILDVFTHACEVDGKADLAVIEGVRGLYEGLESKSDIGSTAQIAKILKCPVILVINARSITRSAAAIVNGYQSFDPDINIVGVILNNVGNKRHEQKSSEAIEHYTNLPVLGIIKRDNSMQISMRHLGLVPALEGRRRVDDFDSRIEAIKNHVSAGINLEKIVEIAKQAPELPKPEQTIFTAASGKTEKVTIGVALDEAFNFYYQNNLELLELAGAKLTYFSPLHDESLPKVDALYIGGGYPELFAEELEANKSIRKEILEASKAGMPIYGECGGLIYLTEKLTTGVKGKGTYNMADMPENTCEMVGALPGHTIMGLARVVSYNNGTLDCDTAIGKKGKSFIGHEFHHSEIRDIPDDAKFAIRITRGTGIREGWDGLTVNNTLGCYAHLEAASYQYFATSFVEAAREYRQRR